MSEIKLYNDNCIKVMQQLIEQKVKVDAVITDPPYGMTACKWDFSIELSSMWERLYNITKEHSPIVLFSA